MLFCCAPACLLTKDTVLFSPSSSSALRTFRVRSSLCCVRGCRIWKVPSSSSWRNWDLWCTEIGPPHPNLSSDSFQHKFGVLLSNQGHCVFYKNRTNFYWCISTRGTLAPFHLMSSGFDFVLRSLFTFALETELMKTLQSVHCTVIVQLLKPCLTWL